jgi:cytochrome P450
MPDSFWPDRWLYADNPARLASSSDIKDEYIHIAAAFIPFSFGPANCVGKNLAYQEMRTVVCSVMQKLELRFADGYRWDRWEDTLCDYFTMSKGELPVVITRRT